MDKLRNILNDYYYLSDLGRINHGRILCTVKLGVLDHPIHLADPTFISKHHISYWNSRDQLFIRNNKQPILANDDVVAFISPVYFAVFFRNGFFLSHFGGLLYTADKHFIYNVFGDMDSAYIKRALDHHASWVDWLPFPGRLMTVSSCEEDLNLCLTVLDSRLGLYRLSRPYLLSVIIISLGFGISSAFFFEYLRIGPRAFVRRLRKAIRQKKIYPVYQPKVKLDSGKIVGIEALARWHENDMGMVSPDLFISVAEESSLINDFTMSFINTVFTELHELLCQDRHLTVSINISPCVLVRSYFLIFLKKEIAKYQFRSHQVILEITERTNSDNEMMALSAKKMTEQGYRLSLDDFGTGFSNLSWLTTFEPHEIKIDKMFTQAIDTQTVNNITLHGLFNMIDSLEVDVVFEGIESLDQLEYIRSRVPEAIGQGWLFSKPVDVAELKKVIGDGQRYNPEIEIVSIRKVSQLKRKESGSNLS
jgi:sensor c-di-GMP phosphodiesterase-like protein